MDKQSEWRREKKINKCLNERKKLKYDDELL